MVIFYFPCFSPVLFTAPNVYSLPGTDKLLHENSPQYSFGSRTEIDKPSDTPGAFCFCFVLSFFHMHCKCLFNNIFKNHVYIQHIILMQFFNYAKFSLWVAPLSTLTYNEVFIDLYHTCRTSLLLLLKNVLQDVAFYQLFSHSIIFSSVF